jgi:hypothetical protein
LGSAEVPSQSVVMYDDSNSSWGAPARVNKTSKKEGIMGDRGQVKIMGKDLPDLYLYAHWGAESLPSMVADALDRSRSRWDDDEYLNRIIFSEMIKDDVMGLTGYGIGFSEHGDVWRVVEVNLDDKTAVVRDLDYENWDATMDSFDDIEWKYLTEPMSFASFIFEYESAVV